MRIEMIEMIEILNSFILHYRKSCFGTLNLIIGAHKNDIELIFCSGYFLLIRFWDEKRQNNLWPYSSRAADLRPAPAGGRGAFVFISYTSRVLTCVKL